MIYQKEIVKEWNIFNINGEMSLNSPEELDNLYDEVRKLVSQGKYKFIFNLNKVPFLDSSGLSVIVLTLSNAHNNNENIRICGLNKDTKRAFELLKVDKLIKYFEDIEQATIDLA